MECPGPSNPKILSLENCKSGLGQGLGRTGRNIGMPDPEQYPRRAYGTFPNCSALYLVHYTAST
jgi:hypothetical protein